MSARIRPLNRNNRQPVDLSNQNAVREFFRKQWHRPRQKVKSKIVRTIKINGKRVDVKTGAKLSDDENSKKICRRGYTDGQFQVTYINEMLNPYWKISSKLKKNEWGFKICSIRGMIFE